jgi:hypothetical protein
VVDALFVSLRRIAIIHRHRLTSSQPLCQQCAGKSDRTFWECAPGLWTGRSVSLVR